MMKPQDIIFIIALLFLFWKRDPRWFVLVGIAFLVLSMPLFHLWIFFTAQRLVLYAFITILIATILLMFKNR